MIFTGDRMTNGIDIENDDGWFKVFFEENFNYYDNYEVIVEIAENARPSQRDWFYSGNEFLKFSNDEFGKAMSNSLNPLIEEEAEKRIDTALRQGFLDGMNYSHVEIHVSKNNHDKPKIILDGEIEGVRAKKNIRHADFYLDGHTEYTIFDPEIVEITDQHVTLKFKKDL